jgi:hypothetical protein
LRGQRIHKIINVDENAMMGECAHCGLVRVKKKNRGMRFACSLAENRFKGQKRTGSRIRKSKDGESPYWATSESKKRREAKKSVQVCEICGCGPTSKGFQWDHDHETGKFRGFLCQRCNCALGLFMDDEENLLCAIEYLRRHKSKAA